MIKGALGQVDASDGVSGGSPIATRATGARPRPTIAALSGSGYTARLFVHQFRISTIDELDDDFGTLLCEAYQV
ncbi:MAG: hypothetical protein M3070_02265, partial [Actinomycetota bacterium]|nr:hypothetical protein [Actinomycetota bacterium]